MSGAAGWSANHQLRRLRAAIASYCSGQIDLQHLVNSVEASIGALEGVPDKWKDECHKECEMLKDIVSAEQTSKDRWVAGLDPKRNSIDITVSRLLVLVLKEMKRLGG